MPQDGLISYGIEGNDRWRFLSEIRIGNVDERFESVISEIGAEDDWAHVRADAEGIDRDIRSAASCDSDLSRTLMILPVAWLKVSTLADTVPSEFETASQSRPSVPLDRPRNQRSSHRAYRER